MTLTEKSVAARAELALCVARNVPKGFHFQVLCDETFCWHRSVDNTIFKRHVTMDDFLSAIYVELSPRSGREGLIDILLQKRSLSRDVAVTVSSLAAIAPLVIETKVTAVLPRRLAAKADKVLPFRMFDLPFDLPIVQSKLIWGRDADQSPVPWWFRRHVPDIASSTDR